MLEAGVTGGSCRLNPVILAANTQSNPHPQTLNPDKIKRENRVPLCEKLEERSPICVSVTGSCHLLCLSPTHRATSKFNSQAPDPLNLI